MVQATAQLGKFQRKAEKLYITEYTPKAVNDTATASPKPTHSRLLKVYEERNKDREKQRNGALSFRNPEEDK